MSRVTAFRRIVWLLPAAAALLVYANTLDGKFVFDDASLILENPWVKELRLLPHALSHPVWAFKVTTPTNYYRPLPIGLLNLLWAGSGGQPWAFHAWSVLLHALNSAALGLLVRRLAGDDVLAASAALLFAVHPINTEAVAWVSCIFELTYTLLCLTALTLHACRRRGLALLCFGLATFSKETALALVPAIFALELCVRPDRPAALWGAIRRAAQRTLPYALAAAPYLVIRFFVIGGIAPRAQSLGWLDALRSAPLLLLDYVRVLALPLRLAAYHVFDPVRSIWEPAFAGSAIALLALLVIVVWLARRRPELALAAALIFFPLLPVLYVPALGPGAFAEHYTYLPAAGFVWMACGAVAVIVRKRAAVAVFALVLATVSAPLTISRNRQWHDDLRLANSTIRVEPRGFVGHMLLGNYHLERDEPESALAAFEQGSRLATESLILETNAIGLRLQLGRIDPAEAIRRLQSLQAGGATVSQVSVHLALGYAYVQMNRMGEAAAEFERALELLPVADGALFALAVIASKRGNDEQAVEYCQRALAIDPRSPAAQQQLGISQLRLGHLDAAIDSLEAAVALDRSDARAHGRLATAYAAGGRRDDARRSWEAALAIDPTYGRAREELRRMSASDADPQR